MCLCVCVFVRERRCALLRLSQNGPSVEDADTFFFTLLVVRGPSPISFCRFPCVPFQKRFNLFVIFMYFCPRPFASRRAVRQGARPGGTAARAVSPQRGVLPPSPSTRERLLRRRSSTPRQRDDRGHLRCSRARSGRSDRQKRAAQQHPDCQSQPSPEWRRRRRE